MKPLFTLLFIFFFALSSFAKTTNSCATAFEQVGAVSPVTGIDSFAHPAVDINVLQHGRYSYLTYASQLGHAQMVERLLGHPNIDITARGSERDPTPLTAASYQDHPDVIRILIQDGRFDVNEKGGYIENAILFRGPKKRPLFDISSPLYRAIFNQSYRAAVELIVDPNINPNVGREGHTVLEQIIRDSSYRYTNHTFPGPTESMDLVRQSLENAFIALLRKPGTELSIDGIPLLVELYKQRNIELFRIALDTVPEAIDTEHNGLSLQEIINDDIANPAGKFFEKNREPEDFLNLLKTRP